MSSFSKRQWVLGAGLTATLAAVAWISLKEPAPDTSTVAAVREGARPGAVAATRRRSSEDSVLVGVEPSRLIRVVQTRKVGDPFTSRSFVPPPPRPAITVAPPPPAPVVAAPPPVPTAPPFPWTFMGRLIEDPDNPAVFLARSDRLTVAHIGDTLDNVWKVEGMDARALRVEYLPLRSALKVSLPSGSDAPPPAGGNLAGAGAGAQPLNLQALQGNVPQPAEPAQEAPHPATPAGTGAPAGPPPAVTGIEISSGIGTNR